METEPQARDWLRNPLPPAEEDTLFANLRLQLDPCITFDEIPEED